MLCPRLRSKRSNNSNKGGKDAEPPYDKELHLSLKMASNDFERRLQQMRRFLEEGHRCGVRRVWGRGVWDRCEAGGMRDECGAGACGTSVEQGACGICVRQGIVGQLWGRGQM